MSPQISQCDDLSCTDAMDEFVDQECKMTLEEFADCVLCGALVDYDGSGVMGTDTQIGSASIHPSDIKNGKELPPWATHVYWYNK
jgi:hypothetical protein